SGPPGARASVAVRESIPRFRARTPIPASAASAPGLFVAKQVGRRDGHAATAEVYSTTGQRKLKIPWRTAFLAARPARVTASVSAGPLLDRTLRVPSLRRGCLSAPRRWPTYARASVLPKRSGTAAVEYGLPVCATTRSRSRFWAFMRMNGVALVYDGV